MATIRQSISSYAITISTFERQRHFQKESHAELLIGTLFRYREQGQFLLHAFVVMPDHIHVLITPSWNVSTAKAVQFIKGGYSHAVRDREAGAVWHSGYHEHRIRDLADYGAQVGYIAANPTKKRYELYPYVHTACLDRIDGVPAHLR